MQFTGGTGPRPHDQPHHRPDAIGIADRAVEANPDPGTTRPVVQDAGLACLLAHRQVGTTVSIQVGHGAAPLLTREVETGLAGTQSAESSPTIPEEDQPCAGILAGRLVIHPEEILGEEEVFVPVAVEIGHGDTECGGELRLGRQRHGLETAASIEKNHRVHGVHSKGAPPGSQRTQQGLETQRRELPVRLGSFREGRDGPRQGRPGTPGRLAAGERIPGGHEGIDPAWLVEFAVNQLDRRMARTGLVRPPVASPIGGHQVQSAVPIEVRGGDSVPEAAPGGQARFDSGIDPAAGVIAEEAQRIPVRGQHQVRIAIAIGIGEDGPVGPHGVGDGPGLSPPLGPTWQDDGR